MWLCLCTDKRSSLSRAFLRCVCLCLTYGIVLYGLFLIRHQCLSLTHDNILLKSKRKARELREPGVCVCVCVRHDWPETEVESSNCLHRF